MFNKHSKGFGQTISSVLLAAILSFALPVPVSAETGPVETLEVALVDVTSTISEKATVFQQDKDLFYNYINTNIMPIMDVELFSRAVLGRHGRAASSRQMSDFQSAFKDFLIASYGDALLQYRGESVNFKPAQINEGKRTTARVDSVLLAPEGDYQITYSMILDRDDDSWKIYDVLFEDLSLGINFRNSYSDIIEQKGLDHLIGLLRDKSAPVPESD